MIIFEITDETGMTHYEILGIAREELDKLDDKAIARKVGTAMRIAAKPYFQASQRGDKQANAIKDRLNQAATILKDPERRSEYDKGLAEGKGAVSELIRLRPITPPFFRDRGARWRLIERMMREAGMLPQETDF